MASLDLAGAFDTLDKDVMIKKLSRTCGITDKARDLMNDYLAERNQRVKKNEGTGRWMENLWGVPQGSVLGPLLFVMLCADIQEAMPTTQITQFADDVTIVATADRPHEAIVSMNRSLAEFDRYAAGNRMAPEPEKTQILYSAAPSIRSRMKGMECEMAGHKLKVSQEIKVLGFTLDEQISGEAHCAIAAAKSDRANQAIKRTGKYLKENDRAQLAKSLAHPHLDYCQNAMRWQSGTATDILDRAYNRTARMAAKSERSAPALEKLKWDQWEERKDKRQKTFVTKIYERKEPEILYKRIPGKLQGSMQTRAMARGELEEPGAKLEIGEQAFGIWAPRLLNEIKREQWNKENKGKSDQVM